jgi:N-acyl-D-aspartate/D-glutamate deacylase
MWPVHFLSHWIRDRQLMTLEQAHYKMSAYPAWLADYKDRGALRKGAWADIMIYDMDQLGYVYNRPIYANDFPGGERRKVQKPVGIRYILVNGTVTFQENQCTGALPGKLLRSYDMTD